MVTVTKTQFLVHMSSQSVAFDDNLDMFKGGVMQVLSDNVAYIVQCVYSGEMTL